jgi:hypothetical protein
MKSLKVSLMALLGIAIIGAAFAFTTKKAKFITATKFLYVGPSNPIISDLTNQANWQVTTGTLTPSHNNTVIYAVEVLGSFSTYVDDNGTPSNINDDKLKVNTSSTFQTDVKDAGGPSDGDAVVNEIFRTNYSIYSN